MFRYRLRIPVIAVVVLVTISSLLFLSQRSSASPTLRQDEYHFSVKFVCGILKEDPTKTVLAPGIYHTAINIHDPLGSGFKLDKWAVQALPEEQEPGPQTDPRSFDVGEFGAFEIDCPEIWDWFGVEYGTFLKGFVHLRTSVPEPEVVAVYTAQGLEGGPVSIDVERYLPRGR